MIYKIDITSVQTVAIFFWGRSGSLFMGSLLDSHKNILSLPTSILTNFFDINGFWNRNNSYGEDILLTNFCSEFKVLFNYKIEGSNDSTSSEYIRIDIDQFKTHMRNFTKENSICVRQNFFIYCHYAYELCLNRDISTKYIINFQIHDPKAFTRVNEFLKDFPKTKFIGMYREPIRALYSHMRHHKDDVVELQENKDYESIDKLYGWRKKIPNLKYTMVFTKAKYSLTEEVLDGQYYRYYEHQVIGWKKTAVHLQANLLPVKLEDLHDYPKITTQKVANFIGIDYDDSLLKSTVSGKKFWGDKRAVGKINGFSSSHTRTSNYKECFNQLDVYVLNNIVSRIHPEYAHLKSNNLTTDKLLNLINIPTQIEFNSMNILLGTNNFEYIMDSYEKRVAFSKAILKTPSSFI